MIIAVLLVLGLCFGSFVNALVWRLHKGRNWVSERSECVHCHHTLATMDLIPVVSWVALRGKCRYCKQPIDDSPITELVTAVLFVISYLYWPFELVGLGWLSFVIWLVIVVGFMAMSLYDLRWMTLPNKLTYVFTAVALIQVLVTSIALGDAGVIWGAVGGLLTVGGVFYALFQVSGGKWIGGGDVKLGFMLGLLAGGIIEGLLLIFIASALGTLLALPALITKKTKINQKVPFGPFLIAATFVVSIFGQNIIDWYQSLLIV